MLRNDLSLYDQNAANWWNPTAKFFALNHLNPLRFQYFDQHIQAWKNLRVLDLGCGGGYTCEFLAQRGVKVYGIDQSAACIAVAAEHAQSLGYYIDYLQGYAEELPYPDSYFDAVVCVDVLEHVVNIEQTITQIGRVLKPGGFFCFDTINKTLKSRLIMIWILEMLLQEIPSGIHDWQKFIAPARLESLLIKNEFVNIAMTGFQLFGTNFWEYFWAYKRYKKIGDFGVKFNRDFSLLYVGVAQKAR